MSENIYAIKYNYKFDYNEGNGWTKEELENDPERPGACDALVFISITREGKGAHKGSTSHAWLSKDGHNNGEPIPNTEMFSVWSSIAKALSEDDETPPWQRDICQKAFEEVRQKIVVEGRGMGTK